MLWKVCHLVLAQITISWKHFLALSLLETKILLFSPLEMTAHVKVNNTATATYIVTFQFFARADHIPKALLHLYIQTAIMLTIVWL